MLNKKSFLIFICISLLFFAGCSNKDTKIYNLTFIGESDNWTAELKVESKQTFIEIDNKTHYDSQQKKSFTLTYKGDSDKLLDTNLLTYSFEHEGGGGKGTIEKPHERVIKHTSSGSGVWLIPEDDVIKVTVDLDGETESFELKIKNQQ